MTVCNHGLILAQSFLLESIFHFGRCLEFFPITEESCPFKPSSMRDSPSAFVAVSAFLARELCPAPHVKIKVDRAERSSSAVARSLETGLTWKVFCSGSTIP